jgi:superfamily II RNA helicase
MRVEDMIKRSFSEFAQQKEAPAHAQRLADNETKLNALGTDIDCSTCDIPAIHDYHSYVHAPSRYHHICRLICVVIVHGHV